MAGVDGKETSTDAALGPTRDARKDDPEAADTPTWLGDRFRVKRLLGRGGMGAVYLATDEVLGKDVALKLVDERLSGRLERLRDEVLLAQDVSHPNVCRTYDLEEIAGHWLIKMEYVEGETLAKRLAAGPLPVPETIRMTSEICAGLAAAHARGVVHRDLKPPNIMLEAQTGRVVLMDFGIARASALAGQTADNVSGTPEYMAPEQARGREVDARADLYSLGCVLYEMLVSERVFGTKTGMAAALAHAEDPPPALPARVPERLRRLVARLLEKDPARRPASAGEVAAALAPRQRLPIWWLAAAGALVSTALILLALRPTSHWQPQIRELPAYDENADHPVFSPDGTQIAYLSDRDPVESMRLYVAPLEGGSPRALTPPELAPDNPRWTRDGRAILFNDFRQRRGYRVAVAGGAPEVLAEDAQSVEDCAGRLLIQYMSSRGCDLCQRLALREPDGQERELVRFTAGQSIYEVSCDREGRRVLYSLADRPAVGPHHAFDLWLLALDGGSPRRLTHDQANNHGKLTPDGRSIVFSATRSGPAHLWEMPVDGAGKPVQLTFGPGWEYSPDVSADGRLVVYDVDVSSLQLYAQPLAGGPQKRLTSNLLDVTLLEVTPDGHDVIAAAILPSLQKYIVRIRLDTGDPVPLVEGETPSLTPDGTEILYSVADTGRVMALPRAGGSPRTVTEVPGTILHVLAGSDGRVHVRVLRPQSWEAWSAPLSGGAAERELPAPWIDLWPAPRGGWRAALQLVTRSDWRVRFLAPGMSLDDPSARELQARGWAAWMPDGRSWLYTSDGRLHRFRVDTGEDEAVLPDQKFWMFATDGTTLYTTQLVSRVRRELIANFADRPRL